MPSVETLDGSLDRVRTGLERRVAALGGRVGDHLAAYVGQPGKMLRARYALLLGGALDVRPDVCESVARAVELSDTKYCSVSMTLRPQVHIDSEWVIENSKPQ